MCLCVSVCAGVPPAGASGGNRDLQSRIPEERQAAWPASILQMAKNVVEKGQTQLQLYPHLTGVSILGTSGAQHPRLL